GVVGNEVKDHFHRAPMRRFEKPHEASEVATHRGNIAVIRDVAAEIGHWRGKDRRDPNRIDLEPGKVVQSAYYALKVTNAVAVRIQERARIDLIMMPCFHQLAANTQRVLLRRSKSECVGVRFVPPQHCCEIWWCDSTLMHCGRDGPRHTIFAEPVLVLGLL